MLVPLAILDALLGDEPFLKRDELLVHLLNTLDGLLQLLGNFVFLPAAMAMAESVTAVARPLFLQPNRSTPNTRAMDVTINVWERLHGAVLSVLEFVGMEPSIAGPAEDAADLAQRPADLAPDDMAPRKLLDDALEVGFGMGLLLVESDAGFVQMM